VYVLLGWLSVLPSNKQRGEQKVVLVPGFPYPTQNGIIACCFDQIIFSFSEVEEGTEDKVEVRP
jgi:hypothetical protein